MSKINVIKVVELFAGVGGFRLGLEAADKNLFKTIYANQWEPGKKKQYAADCYKKNFRDDILVCEDIAKIKNDIPEHDLLVGGFPCQDYSVAAVKAKGIKGKKGVLWWEIYDIIKNKSPKYVLLENVDRLIKSPSYQRGRDFSVMLTCLMNEGYVVEWRVINAADYGFGQRRRRVFIFARKNYKKLNIENYIENDSIFKKAFPDMGLNKSREAKFNFQKMSIKKISDSVEFKYWNFGVAIKGKIITQDLLPKKQKAIPLKKLIYRGVVNKSFFLTKEQNKKMEYIKGAKKIERTTKNGFKYFYSEGGMIYPEDLSKPGRTILTSEGSINRSTHVINDYKTKMKRFILPIEAERMQGFPDNWTADMPEKMRLFIMGNALVVGVVEKIGIEIKNID